MATANFDLINQCNFFLKKKKRYCRMSVKKGQKYCGEHMFFQEEDSETEKNDFAESPLKRVPCPFDNTHTCYARYLHKHIKKCNSRPKEKPSFYTLDINRGGAEEGSQKQRLADISDDELLGIINKVEQVYQDAKPNIKEDILNHPALSEELANSEYGVKTLKHLKQNSSLLGHMSKAGWLLDETCFIEFGAGRGQLTYWLIQAIENPHTCKFVLVDRASHRHKYENKLKMMDSVVRIRMDIADLNLSAIEEIRNFQRVVATGKHLCGVATDLALRCLVKSGDKERDGLKVTGLILSFCCHHRCEWESYVGKEFLLESGFTSSQFHVMKNIVSWATCGTGRSRQHGSNQKTNNTPLQKNSANDSTAPSIEPEADNKYDRYARLNLDQQQREQIGRKCKHILDWGRFQYLQKHGFHGNLIYYVTSDVSLENLCVLAELHNTARS